MLDAKLESLRRENEEENELLNYPRVSTSFELEMLTLKGLDPLFWLLSPSHMVTKPIFFAIVININDVNREKRQFFCGLKGDSYPPL